MEVSSSLLSIDLGRKAALYATAGMPDYWVIDLGSRRVLVHAQPDGAGYRASNEVALGAVLTPVAIDGLSIETGFLFD